MIDLSVAMSTTLSGALVGLVLGLVGGGGSILAVPLLVYAVGITSPHVAIGTSAIAVSLSALGNVVGHARAGHVKWRCAGVFASAGVVGAVAGSIVAKAIDGQKLLALFGGVDGRRRAHHASQTQRRRQSRRSIVDDNRSRAFTAADRHRLRRGPLVGLLWHRWWLPDRARSHACNRHAADVSDRHLSGCSRGVRGGHRGELCRLGSNRLADRRHFCLWRADRRASPASRWENVWPPANRFSTSFLRALSSRSASMSSHEASCRCWAW